MKDEKVKKMHIDLVLAKMGYEETNDEMRKQIVTYLDDVLQPALDNDLDEALMANPFEGKIINQVSHLDAIALADLTVRINNSLWMRPMSSVELLFAHMSGNLGNKADFMLATNLSSGEYERFLKLLFKDQSFMKIFA